MKTTYIVVMVSSFDSDTPAVLFDDYNEAKAYLHWLWEDYYNIEIALGSHLIETQCFHEEEYAKVTWSDNNTTEFILTFASSPDERFYRYRYF